MVDIKKARFWAVVALSVTCSAFSVNGAEVRDVVQEAAAYQFDTTSPALMDPAITRYATSVHSALEKSPDALVAFVAAFAPFTQSNRSAKEYKIALRGLSNFAKNEAFRVLDKTVRRDFGLLVKGLRSAVQEFIRLRPFVLVDPRVSAARLLQQQRRARRVANAAIALATIAFAAVAAGGLYAGVRYHNDSKGLLTSVLKKLKKD